MTAARPMTSGPALTLLAPAKVNLYLHVCGKRPNGYHDLDSLVVFAGGGDHLRFAPAPDQPFTLSVDGPTAPLLAAETAAQDNIIDRAARLLAEAAGVTPTGRLHLHKILPVAAGIGGGSADAAAALRLLRRGWGLESQIDDAALEHLGLSLGADVPVCLRGRPTGMAGIGEILTDVPPLPPVWLVLVNPRQPLATPAVFRARLGGFAAPAPVTEAPADAAALIAALAERHNGLTAPACILMPKIATILEQIALRPGCGLARMSGSGATCFGLFAAQEMAERAASDLAWFGWWTMAAPLLDQAAAICEERV